MNVRKRLIDAGVGVVCLGISFSCLGLLICDLFGVHGVWSLLGTVIGMIGGSTLDLTDDVFPDRSSEGTRDRFVPAFLGFVHTGFLYGLAAAILFYFFGEDESLAMCLGVIGGGSQAFLFGWIGVPERKFGPVDPLRDFYSFKTWSIRPLIRHASVWGSTFASMGSVVWWLIGLPMMFGVGHGLIAGVCYSVAGALVGVNRLRLGYVYREGGEREGYDVSAFVVGAACTALARTRRLAEIPSEYFLLALLREWSTTEFVRWVLKECGTDVGGLEHKLTEVMSLVVPADGDEVEPAAGFVLQNARVIADELEARVVDVRHLLLAMCTSGSCRASELLETSGCNLDKLRGQLEQSVTNEQ